MTTQALILAAGRGSRMKGATAGKPKCLIPLAGKTLLQWQLDSLRAAGVETITVARGYKAESLKGGFETVDNPRWAETNMVSTLLCAMPVLGQSPCIVSYSDIVYHPSHVKTLMECDGDISLLYDTDWRSLWETRFADPLEDAETFFEKDGVLKEIGNRTSSYSDIQGQYMGLLRFSPSGFTTVRNYLEGLSDDTVSKLDMTALLQRLLSKGITINVKGVSGKWCESDSMDDVVRYEKCLAENQMKCWSHDWR